MPPNLSQIFLPTGDQVFKYLSCGGYSHSNHILLLSHPSVFPTKTFVSLLTFLVLHILILYFFCEISISKCILGSLVFHPLSCLNPLNWSYTTLSGSLATTLSISWLYCVDLLHRPLGLRPGLPNLHHQTPTLYPNSILHAPFSGTKSFVEVRQNTPRKFQDFVRPKNKLIKNHT